MKNILLLIFLCCGVLSCRFPLGGAKIPLIGIDPSGKEVIKIVSVKSHTDYMSDLVNETSENISPNIGEYDRPNAWKLSRLDINLVISLGFSFFDFYSWEISPAARLQFGRK